MTILRHFCCAAAVMAQCDSLAAQSFELSTESTLEMLIFPESGAISGQDDHAFRLNVIPKVTGQIGAAYLDLAPELTWASTHGDLEISPGRSMISMPLGDVTLGIGFAEESWGVQEFLSVVDVINERNLSFSPFLDDKRSQPLVALDIPIWNGTFRLAYLAGKPDRQFPDADDRFSPGIALGPPEVEDGEDSFALSYVTTIGAVDLSLYHFQGPDRTPIITAGGTGPFPFHPHVSRSGFDAVTTWGDAILRMEAMHIGNASDTDGNREDAQQLALGVEYTLPVIFGEGTEISLLAEYATDSRGTKSPENAQNDIAVGVRGVWNDIAGTEASLVAIHDLDFGSTVVSATFERRIGETLSLEVEALAITGAEGADPLAAFANDSHLRLSLTRYF